MFTVRSVMLLRCLYDHVPNGLMIYPVLVPY